MSRTNSKTKALVRELQDKHGAGYQACLVAFEAAIKAQIEAGSAPDKAAAMVVASETLAKKPKGLP